MTKILFIILIISVNTIICDDSIKVYQIEPIIVSASKLSVDAKLLPYSAKIIDTPEINNSNGSNISSVLKNNTLLFVNSYGAVGQLQTISSRGTSADESVVLINGMRLNQIQNGTIDLGLIPIESVERVEILKVGNSSLYGSNAIGSVINVVTKNENTGIKNIAFGMNSFDGNKSPYKIAIANSSKAYVTNLYDNSVTSFNPTTLQIIKERISVGKNPQSLLVNGNKLYVCNSGWGSDSTVSIIDISKDSVIKTLTIGDQPSGIGIDADGEIIVKFDGKIDFTNPSKDTEGGVAIINPSTDEIKSKSKLSLSTYGHGEKFISTKKNYALLQTNIGIVKYNTITNIFESTSFINTSQFTVNGIFVDEANELFYISDAKDYTNTGEIHIYKNDGSKIGSYKTGIIPGSIAFVR